MADTGHFSDQKARAFISYSRADSAFVSRLEEALEIGDVTVLRDTGDILPSEAWWKKIVDLIAQADNVVFVVSPDSLASKVVQEELDAVRKHNKRLIPIVCRPIDGIKVPAELSELNYIYFTKDDDFIRQVRVLLGALRLDMTWIRQHTDMGLSARRWAAADPSHASELLLRGPLLLDAETWLARRPRDAPEPTRVQIEYIAASKRAADKRGRSWLAGSLVVTAFALSLAGFAVWQMLQADTERQQARKSEAMAQQSRALAVEAQTRAEASSKQAAKERDLALLTQSRFLASTAQKLLETGNATAAALVALEALPGGGDLATRPFAPEALSALHGATYRLNETATTGNSLEQGSCIDGRPARSLAVDGNTVTLLTLGNRAATRRFTANMGAVVHAELAPDHNWLFTASNADGLVRVWDVQTGQLVTRPLRLSGVFAALQVSKSGRRALVTSRLADTRQAAIWDISADGALRHLELPKPAAAETTWEMNSTGDRALIYSYRAPEVTVFDADQSKVVKEFRRNTSAWSSRPEFSPSGKVIVLECETGTVVVLDSATGDEQFRIALSADVAATRISPDDRRLAIVLWPGPSPQVVRVWDLKSGKELPALEDSHRVSYDGLEFSRDSKLIFATDREGAARVWSADGGKPLHVIPAPTQRKPGDKIFADLAGDATRIAVGYSSGELGVYELASKKRIASWAAEVRPRNVELKPKFCGAGDSSVVVELDNSGERSGHSIAIEAGGPARALSTPKVLAMDPHDGRLFVQVATGVAKLDPDQGAIIRTFDAVGGGAIDRVAVSVDGSRIAGANLESGTVTIWDASSGAQMVSFTIPDLPLTDFALSVSGRLLISGAANGVAAIWDTVSGTKLHTLAGHTKQIHRVHLAATARHALTVSGDGTVRLWALAEPISHRILDEQKLRDDQASSQAGALHSGAMFSPDGRSVLISTSQGEVRFVDVETGSSTTLAKGHDIYSHQVATVDATGRWIAVVHPYENSFDLFEAAHSDKRRRILAHGGAAGAGGSMQYNKGLPLDNAVFSPDGKRVITTFTEGVPQIWDVETGALIATLDAFHYGRNVPAEAQWSTDGTRLLIWSPRSSRPAMAYLWRQYPSQGELVAYVKASVPRCLTEQERDSLFLDPAPPAWCREMKKWPYE